MDRPALVSIRGVGLVLPGASTLADLAGLQQRPELLAGATKQVDPLPLPRGMIQREARRSSRLTRLALYAADQALEQAGLEGMAEMAVLVGLTHGSTSYLQEFHELWLEHGPEAASPSAFSGGVTNAPLAAISTRWGLQGGGITLVGHESCGLELLCLAAEGIGCGHYLSCCAGAAEEYSPLVDQIYARKDQACRLRASVDEPAGADAAAAARLPGLAPEELARIGRTEGAVFFVLTPVARSGPGQEGCLFSPGGPSGCGALEVDVIVSGVSGGAQDPYEAEALRAVLQRQRRPTHILYSKLLFGETFAPGPLLGGAAAWDMLIRKSSYPTILVGPGGAGPPVAARTPSTVQRIMVIAAGREGQVCTGLFTTTEEIT